jgi:glycosyltransferase involved in cell wall biosynthesis
MARKDCKMGFEALNIVKAQIPQLKIVLFGTPDQPQDLPEWYEYYQSPPQALLRKLYNQCAVYAGTSQVEGWGLTVGEAMLCGAAVACTDNKGYLEMAKDGETALVSPVGDAAALAANIIKLLENDDLRQQIAAAGHKNIQQFSQDGSCRKFLNCFENKS